MSTIWRPFTLPWDDAVVDVSFLFEDERPAGRHGFLGIRDGRLAWADGEPARFWGTCFNSGANFPEHAYSEMVARRLEKFGVNIVRTHHERFNGDGYPYGLRGKEIPLGSRIISVVESYAAMIHERPTRPALSEREALDTLKENYGLRYDREVVLQFNGIMEKELARSVQTDAAAALQGR